MSFSEHLDDLFKVHFAAMECEHGIKRSNKSDKWTPFTPSKFIYSYFAFNSLYSVDWKNSVKKGQFVVLDWKSHYELDKIDEMEKFIKNVLKDEFAKRLPEYIEKHLGNISVERAKNELKNIQSNSRIGKSLIDRFRESFNNVMEGQKLGSSVERILHFVYHVRNNVFHGTKKILSTSASQNKRLTIYTAILLAMNDLLFEAVEATTDWKKDRVLRDQKP